MSEEELRKIRQEIIDGNYTLRGAAKKLHIDRRTLEKLINNLSDEGQNQGNPTAAEEFRKKLKENYGSSRLPLDGNMEKIIIAILNGEITAKQAHIIYGIDRETIRRNINALVQKDPAYLKAYFKYCSKSKIDYGKINFKGLIVHMLKNDMSQSEMAREYNIPARTISREVSKLSESSDPKDLELYRLAKECARKKMEREDLTEEEIMQHRALLNRLFPNIEIIENNKKSNKELEIEQLERFLDVVKSYEAKGMTQQEIAKAMNVSISTIRRRKLRLEELKNGLADIQTGELQ